MAENFAYTFPGEHQYEGITLGSVYKPEVLKKVKEFTFRVDDILLVGYPKSGRLWLEELVWLLENDLDTKEAMAKSLRTDRVIPLEISAGSVSNLDRLEEKQDQRIMSSFMYANIFEQQLRYGRGPSPKVIVMLRNPKDVLLSYFHFYRMAMMTGNFPGTWDQFFELAKNKKLNLGDWFDHVSSWWNLGGKRDNFMFVHYEEAMKKPESTIAKIATFLNKNVTQDDITMLLRHLSFDSMRNNPTTNMKDIPFYKQEISEFLRKGKVGDWKTQMNQEQSSYIDDMIEDTFSTSGLKFIFEP